MGAITTASRTRNPAASGDNPGATCSGAETWCPTASRRIASIPPLMSPTAGTRIKPATAPYSRSRQTRSGAGGNTIAARHSRCQRASQNTSTPVITTSATIVAMISDRPIAPFTLVSPSTARTGIAANPPARNAKR